jgi:hypothetical protein
MKKDKIENVVLEYEYLLTSQLESQRDYYLHMMHNLETKMLEKVAILESKLDESQAKCSLLEKSLHV